MQNAVLHLFNECHRLEVYPWGTQLVTFLHKKGNLYDPKNYRSITVSSNLGKLFSCILLYRLISFKERNCPDADNQLGLCKKVQTGDHILALKTCIKNMSIKTNKDCAHALWISQKHLTLCVGKHSFISFGKSVCLESSLNMSASCATSPQQAIGKN